VRELGNPIVSTSVKIDDVIDEYLTDPELIYERFGDMVDIVIHGGYGDNVPYTIIDCTDGSPVLIREGKGEFLMEWE
jgi:tRNA A37 threonylcarbamoyladenosine synthetase subunit TsaC/SUA5/YrdC